MIKLLYVINFIRYSGPSNVVRNIIYVIDKTKYEVTFFTLFKNENDPEVVKELRNLNITVVEQNFKAGHIAFHKKLNDYVRITLLLFIVTGLFEYAKCKVQTAAKNLYDSLQYIEDYLQTY